ncbi:Hypothetical predicted protein [Pelobates cultripes]|uniref:Uncharacterized protein n=1 Tax=Pelobates cultripes TaxID=61616 RepID=A0AAD1SWK3_PELCU|nr:Hypothetical predicted protein [Pelobates cultripes]
MGFPNIKAYYHSAILTNVIRWYMVPSWLHTIFPTSPDLCWRCHTTKGTMLHMWWTCERVNSLWKVTATLIKKVTDLQITHDPKTILLRSLPDNTPKPIQKIIYLMLSTVSILIARKWKTTELPSPREIENVMTSTEEYELLMWNQAKIGKISPHTATMWRNYLKQANTEPT